MTPSTIPDAEGVKPVVEEEQGASLQDRATAAEPVVSALRDGIPSALWPVFEFRPLPSQMHGTVLRYAKGEWLPDDGEWDIAFVSYGMGAPLGLGVELPYQRNIIWSGLTSHWAAQNHKHPGSNPWHYMLRDGETQWGGVWGRDQHLNERAMRAAMGKCCAINGCANGWGPAFRDGNPWIEAGMVRERDTKRIVRPPERRQCMYCDDWHNLAQALEARATPSSDEGR